MKRKISLVSPLYFAGNGYTFCIDEFLTNGKYQRYVERPQEDKINAQKDRLESIKKQKQEGFTTLTAGGWNSWIDLVNVIWDLLNFKLPENTPLGLKYSSDQSGLVTGRWDQGEYPREQKLSLNTSGKQILMNKQQMNENESLTAEIIEALTKSVEKRGLLLYQEIPPASQGYSKEWAIQDSDGWCYAGFGVRSKGGYEYTLASNKSLPFDGQEIIDWAEKEIIQIVNSLKSKY